MLQPFIYTGAAEHVEIESEPTTNVSLVTGRINTVGQSSDFGNVSDCVSEDPNSLQQLNSKNSLDPVESGSNFLNHRMWKGLEPRVGEDAVFAATNGRRGLAANYNNEKSN